jgi:hypothetical protein
MQCDAQNDECHINNLLFSSPLTQGAFKLQAWNSGAKGLRIVYYVHPNVKRVSQAVTNNYDKNN